MKMYDINFLQKTIAFRKRVKTLIKEGTLAGLTNDQIEIIIAQHLEVDNLERIARAKRREVEQKKCY